MDASVEIHPSMKQDMPVIGKTVWLEGWSCCTRRLIRPSELWCVAGKYNSIISSQLRKLQGAPGHEPAVPEEQAPEAERENDVVVSFQWLLGQVGVLEGFHYLFFFFLSLDLVLLFFYLLFFFYLIPLCLSNYKKNKSNKKYGIKNTPNQKWKVWNS